MPHTVSIQQFVITLFCLRRPDRLRAARGGGWNWSQDPLQPDFLEPRLKLLEILSASSIRNQTLRDFSWIIVIERELETSVRDKLREIAGQSVRLILHEYSPDDVLDGTDWLTPYMDGRHDYVLTTHLDDDDSLSSTYLDELRKAATASVGGDHPPFVRLFGNNRIWLWNLLHTGRMPLGFRSNWTGSARVPASGFSLLARFPDIPITILALRHKWAESYLDLAEPSENPVVDAFRKRLDAALVRSGTSLDEQKSWLGYSDLSDMTGHVVMGNHTLNAQNKRVLRTPVRPMRVTGPETFPNHVMNWSAASRYLGDFPLRRWDAVKVHWRISKSRIRDAVKRNPPESTVLKM